eukprot:s1861_g2.t1
MSLKKLLLQAPREQNSFIGVHPCLFRCAASVPSGLGSARLRGLHFESTRLFCGAVEAMASASSAALLESFQAFAGGHEMDGRTWDSMLLDEDFTTVDADLIFARVKSRGTRKIDYSTFRRALSEVAKKWQMSQEQVEDIICLAAGPHYENQPQAPEPGIDDPAGPQRFYYDMTLYTGTHKYGGPSLVGNGIVEGAPVNFQEHVNRDRDNEVAASADRRRRAVLGEAGEEMPRLLGKPRSPVAQRRELPKALF